MARDNTIGGLYMRLGLSLSELETDFIAAERTTRENLARLNRQSNLIRLRAEVDIGNLDTASDQLQILTVRENALNEQMAIQRDRIRIADAALRDLIQQHGQESVVAQRAAAALERERLALQRLERELREVTDAREDFNTSNDSGGLGDNLSDLLDNFSSLPVGRLAVFAVGLTALKTTIETVSDATSEMLEKFHELQNQSYELNLPFDQTKQFLRQIKLGGGDIGDFEGYIRGITDAYVKGEFDDPEFIALSKYGAKITDVSGRLKNFKDITEEVYQAWKKADATGEGIEFLQLTGGEAGVRDAIQFFKRYEEAKEDASKVFNSGVNPAELHDAERALNLLTEQTSEFKDAFASIFTPAFTKITESFFDVFHFGTEVLVENKETFKSWGFTASESVSTVLRPLGLLSDAISEISNIKLDFGSELKNNEFQQLLTDSNHTPLDSIKDFFKDNVFDGIIKRSTENQIAYNNAVKDATSSWAAFREEEIRVKEQGNPLNQYDTKRITAFRDALEDLRLEMQYADDKFGLEKAQNDVWLQRELSRKNFLSSDEAEVLRELHAQKMLDIEQRQADEIAKIQEESAKRTEDLFQSTSSIMYGLTHSSFEKQIYDIEQWKEKSIEAMREKGDFAEETAAIIANAAAKEADAFQREMDRIQGRIESAQDKLFRLTHSQYDYDLYQAKQEYQKNIAGNVPQGLAKAVYDATVNQIRERASEDKTGNYTKSKNNYSGGAYIIDFNAPAIPYLNDWATMDSKSLAFGVLEQNNKELANSVRNLTGVNNDLAQAVSKTTQGFEIIEGDQVVTDFTNSAYQLIDAQNNLADSTNLTAQNIAQNTPKFETPQTPKFDFIEDFNSKFSAMSAQLDDSSNSIRNSFDSFLNSMDTLSKSTESVSTSFLNSSLAVDEFSKKISNFQFDIPQFSPQQSNTPSQTDKNVNTPFNPFQSVEQFTQLAGNSIDILSGIADKMYNFLGIDSPAPENSSQLPNLDLNIDSLLVEVRAIRTSVESFQQAQPNIIVSPNINIDLGGAYVFDDSMKQQLTDDVTNEVVSKVTDAFNQATSNESFSFVN